MSALVAFGKRTARAGGLFRRKTHFRIGLGEPAPVPAADFVVENSSPPPAFSCIFVPLLAIHRIFFLADPFHEPNVHQYRDPVSKRLVPRAVLALSLKNLLQAAFRQVIRPKWFHTLLIGTNDAGE